jgi:hypothetical protein
MNFKLQRTVILFFRWKSIVLFTDLLPINNFLLIQVRSTVILIAIQIRDDFQGAAHRDI